jgi:hypothetical protein
MNKFTIVVDSSGLALIGDALSRLPYKDVFKIIEDLGRQIKLQSVTDDATDDGPTGE